MILTEHILNVNVKDSIRKHWKHEQYIFLISELIVLEIKIAKFLFQDDLG